MKAREHKVVHTCDAVVGGYFGFSGASRFDHINQIDRSWMKQWLGSDRMSLAERIFS